MRNCLRMLDRPLVFCTSCSITLNLTVLERGLRVTLPYLSKPALTDGHNITLLHGEARRAVSRDVTMSLLVTTSSALRNAHLYRLYFFTYLR